MNTNIMSLNITNSSTCEQIKALAKKTININQILGIWYLALYPKKLSSNDLNCGVAVIKQGEDKEHLEILEGFSDQNRNIQNVRDKKLQMINNNTYLYLAPDDLKNQEMVILDTDYDNFIVIFQCYNNEPIIGVALRNNGIRKKERRLLKHLLKKRLNMKIKDFEGRRRFCIRENRKILNFLLFGN